MAHEITLSIFFSVWGEDAEGRPIPGDGPGQLRKAVLIHNAAISSVSLKHRAQGAYCGSRLLMRCSIFM